MREGGIRTASESDAEEGERKPPVAVEASKVPTTMEFPLGEKEGREKTIGNDVTESGCFYATL